MLWGANNFGHRFFAFYQGKKCLYQERFLVNAMHNHDHWSNYTKSCNYLSDERKVLKKKKLVFGGGE